MINQDDTYSNALLAKEITITFKAISSDLNLDTSIEDQLNVLPGRV